MMLLFPFLRATMQASPYYATTLGGFKDGHEPVPRFKVFDHNEAPSLDGDFVTVEQESVSQSQLTEWGDPFVTFHFHGKDKLVLWEMARQTRDIFLGLNLLASVNGSTPVQYEVLGPAVFDSGFNPVTKRSVVSVSLRFGIVP